MYIAFTLVCECNSLCFFVVFFRFVVVKYLTSWIMECDCCDENNDNELVAIAFD